MFCYWKIFHTLLHGSWFYCICTTCSVWLLNYCHLNPKLTLIPALTSLPPGSPPAPPLNIDLWAPRLDSWINDVGYVGILWGAISRHLCRLRFDTTPSFGPEAIEALRRDEVILERSWKKSSIIFLFCGAVHWGNHFGLYLILKNSWNETPWYGFPCLKLLVFELLHSHRRSLSRSGDIDLSLSVSAVGLLNQNSPH